MLFIVLDSRHILANALEVDAALATFSVLTSNACSYYLTLCETYKNLPYPQAFLISQTGNNARQFNKGSFNSKNMSEIQRCEITCTSGTV